MIKIFTSHVKTQIGKIYLASTEKGLFYVSMPMVAKKEFETQLRNLYPNLVLINENLILKKTAKQLEKYFKGNLTQFDIPLDVNGTDFEKKVLKKVYQIKYGHTKTYAQIAKAVNSPKAYRAVGSANAKNKIPFIIPCHRVVASNGLGGYAGGLQLKEKLLLLEKVK